MADEQLKRDLKNILKIKGNVTRSRPVKGHFEEPFVQSIEALLKLQFNKQQIQLIEWWLYEKFNQLDGSVLQLNNTETEEEIPSDTAEELWNLLQTLK